MLHETPPLPPAPRPAASPREAALQARAQALETAFLSEMLGLAGLGAAEGPFAGGIGEAQFASFLRQEQAAAMVARGGIGLAETIVRALARHDDAG
jgi:Rod binding domain-containing protein